MNTAIFDPCVLELFYQIRIVDSFSVEKKRILLTALIVAARRLLQLDFPLDLSLANRSLGDFSPCYVFLEFAVGDRLYRQIPYGILPDP